MSEEIAGSNRLAVLGGEIMAAHEASEAAKLASVKRAKDAGIKLIEAKKLIKHGKWLPWLKTIELSPSSAALYMRIARLPPDKFASLAHLSLEAAMEAIAEPRTDPDEDETDDHPLEWTDSQLERRAQAEAGESVIANLHKGVDEALLAWAQGEGRLLRIDRQSPFGNPFEMPDDGGRDDVIEKFAKFYWPHKPELLRQASEHAGKVLACWCYPERCHGHVIAETINRAAAGDGTAEEIAEEIANHDG